MTEDERLHEIALVLAWADGQELDDVRSRAAFWQGCLMSAAECMADIDAVKAAS